MQKSKSKSKSKNVRKHSNIKFEAELEQILRNDDQYQTKGTLERFLYLCEGLIVQWERLHFDSVSRGMKRKEGTDDGEGNKKARGESSGYRPLMIASVGEHCEGCGIPRHKRETCHLREHPDFNKEGKWVNCSSYKKKKALNVSKGVGEEHPMLKWSEYAGGGALADPKYNGSRREREKAAERLEQSGKPSERRRADDSRGGIYGVARQSVPEADGSKPREVRF